MLPCHLDNNIVLIFSTEDADVFSQHEVPDVSDKSWQRETLNGLRNYVSWNSCPETLEKKAVFAKLLSKQLSLEKDD